MLKTGVFKLSKDSLIYGFGGVTEFVAAFFLLPIFTRVFSPSDYGILDTLSTFIGIVTLVLMAGLNSAVYRFYYDATNNRDQRLVISTTLWYFAFVGIAIVGAIALISPWLSHIMFRTSSLSLVLFITVLSTPSVLIIYLVKDVLRLQFAPWKYNVIGLFDFALRISLIIYLVVGRHLGITGNFIGIVISSCFTLVFGLWFIRRQIRISFSMSLLRQMLRFGLPLMFAGLAYWVVSLSDRIFLLKLSTLQELGLYSIGNKISSVVILFVSAFQLAWAPYIMSIFRDEGVKHVIVKVFTYALIGFSILAILVTSASREVLLWLAPENYLGSVDVIGLLTYSLVFLGVSGIIATGFTFMKNTKYITISSFIAAGVNIVLNFLIIPTYGKLGAAISTLISYFVLNLSFWFFSQRVYPLRYEYRKIFIIAALSGICLWVATVFHLENPFMSLGVKLMMLFVFLGCLFIFRVFDNQEIIFIKHTLKLRKR